MKAQSSCIEREIEVVETIIGQLNRCLAIYHKRKMHDEFKVTLKDIQTCKIELKKLIAEKDKQVDIDQGEVNDADFEPNRKNVF